MDEGIHTYCNCSKCGKPRRASQPCDHCGDGLITANCRKCGIEVSLKKYTSYAICSNCKGDESD